MNKKIYTPIHKEDLDDFYVITTQNQLKIIFYTIYTANPVELLVVHHETFDNIPYVNLDHQRLILHLISYNYHVN